MEILIATHNLSKFTRYKKLIESINGVQALSLSDLGITEKVEEIFETNAENALHKAIAYGKMSGKITLAIDEAVLTNFLPDHEQPGVYVRRFSGDKKELSDKEVIEVWKKIFATYPQADKKFIWSFATAFFNPKNSTQGEHSLEQISYVAKNISDKETNGYPMSAILSPNKDGLSYLELDRSERDNIDRKNFKSFLAVFGKWLANIQKD